MDQDEQSAGQVPPRVRQDQMLELVRQSSFVHVNDLARRFGVSEVTVRSDLDALESRDMLRRVRGGAVPRAPSGPERPFEESRVANAEEKMAIGEAAAAMVESGDTVLLDVGTTTTAVAEALARRTDLHDVTVFTSSLTIALSLESATPWLTVVVTGGTLRPLQHSLVDPLGALMLEGIHATRAFLGCNGVDPQAGITNVNLPEAAIKRRMLTAAAQRVVVADGSKVGAITLYRLCGVEDVDLLLTGPSAPQPVVEGLAEGGLDIRTVSLED